MRRSSTRGPSSEVLPRALVSDQAQSLKLSKLDGARQLILMTSQTILLKSPQVAHKDLVALLDLQISAMDIRTRLKSMRMVKRI